MINKKHIVVIGGGFSGLWSALGAARKLDEMNVGPEHVSVTLINRDGYHCIRVRNYEADLSSVRVSLEEILQPAGVGYLQGEVVSIDFREKAVELKDSAKQPVRYDRLVLAMGSELNRPAIPGLTKHGFDVDSYSEAARLNSHLEQLPSRPESPGQFTVLVIGGGLTGIEVAAEMPMRLKALMSKAGVNQPFRVIIADRTARIGSDMGEEACVVIEQALRDLEIEVRTGVSIVAVNQEGAELATGEVIPAASIIWCAGMRANPLTRLVPVERDSLGRVPVDEFMKVKGVQNVFAAGDVAWATLEPSHTSVMSCQHARPMGRFAGYNVVCDLLGEPMLPLHIDWYVTVLDLGAWGALYTEGWERRVISTGEAAKKTKQLINCERIYPPLSGNRREILDAAAPVVQAAPKAYRA